MRRERTGLAAVRMVCRRHGVRDSSPSNHVKFHFSSLGSSVVKYSTAGLAAPSPLAMVKVKASSRGRPMASEPFTGWWTSRRMSKNWPAKKSALERVRTRRTSRGASMAHWSGGKTHPRVGQAPRRRKVCADAAPTSRAAVAPIDLVDFMTNAVESEAMDRTLEDAIAVVSKSCRRRLL